MLYFSLFSFYSKNVIQFSISLSNAVYEVSIYT